MTDEPDWTTGSVTPTIQSVVAVLRSAWRSYSRHRTQRLAASLAYYSIFALAPTLFLALTIVAALFGREATEGRLVDLLDDVRGTEAAEQVDQSVADFWDSSNTSGFAIVTGLVVVYTASILFIAWRDALDAIWEVPYRGGLRTSIRRRVYATVVPVAMGIALAGIVLVEMVTAFIGEFVTAPLPDAILNAVGSVSPAIASTLALGVLYRLSTRCRPEWRDVWVGTVFAALALAVLAWGYGLYVGSIGSSSAAGAAGTIVLGLAFVYYAAQVLLYGGEIISASAERRGFPIRPHPDQPAEDSTSSSRHATSGGDDA
jgi:membrane protein